MERMPSEFSCKRRIEFAETDMAGIAHYSVFFRLMEETEAAFWRSLGLSMFVREGAGPLGWPKVRVSCEYLMPVRFEDVLETRLRVEEVGKRSIRFGFCFRKCSAATGEPERDVARGELKVACVLMNPGGSEELKAIPIPEEIRAKLENGPATS